MYTNVCVRECYHYPHWIIFVFSFGFYFFCWISIAVAMDRMRPVYVRQKSTVGTPGAPSSPMMSPLHRHARSGSTGVANLKKQKAAAQRLAQVMAHQQADEDDEEDDLFNDYSSVSGGSIGLAGGRSMRSRSPLVIGLISMPSCKRNMGSCSYKYENLCFHG